jgi:hypothetical protein
MVVASSPYLQLARLAFEGIIAAGPMAGGERSGASVARSTGWKRAAARVPRNRPGAVVNPVNPGDWPWIWSVIVVT